MGNNRIIWADTTKGWLIVLVILGHAIQTFLEDGCFDNHVFNLIYSFHMPAFMAVSGWLAYKENRKKQGYITACIRRAQQLLIPYFVWSLLRFISGEFTFERLSKIIVAPDAYFWFLWVLFWICCIFTICQWLSDKLKIDELLPIALSSMMFMGIMMGLEFRMFGFQFLAYYFLFYTLGYCIHRFSILQINNSVVLTVLGVVWFLMAWFWNMHELPSWMPVIPHVPSSLLQYAYRGLTAAIAMLLLFGLASKVLDADTRFNDCVKETGVVSLGLYVVHLMIIGDVVDALAFIPSCTVWGKICIIFVVTFILSVIIVELLNKNKWTARFLLGKV